MVDVFGQVKNGRLAGPNECQEPAGVQRGHIQTDGGVDRRSVNPVEGIQNVQHVALPVTGDRPALVHEPPDRFFGQETEERLGIGKAPGDPDQLNILAPEAGRELDADADLNPHDLGGLDQFGGGWGIDEVVVDHPQAPDPLDPGIHDQVGG